MNNIDLLEYINSRICDRSECFYWQTDRRVSVEEAAMIWKDRHSAITNEELLENINSQLVGDKLTYIRPFDENAETSLGNVNSIRVGVLESGREVIIRCHPKGVKNGYFYAESLASSTLLENGIPSYKTYLIHDLENTKDISYQVIEKLDGNTIQSYLKKHKEKEDDLVYEMGRVMANIHKIKVHGYGPFDNEKAKEGKLIGINNTLSEAVNKGLEENLERLVKYEIITKENSKKMKELFIDNKLLDSDFSVLVHNDFADWNLLTDGNSITGVIDFDECVGGHPVEEIACWSTFFEPERLDSFLKGYFSQTDVYDNFDELFQLMRLRYTISKMALRTKRYTYEKTELLKGMIEKGTRHLNELIDYFCLDDGNIKSKTKKS